MKILPQHSRFKNQALTSIEAIIVFGVVILLGVIGWFVFKRESTFTKKAAGIYCVENLKKIGIGLTIYAEDNNDRFPLQVSGVNNTTNELRGGIHPSVYFQTASNELKDIKIFICPFDKTRSAAKSFVDLTDSNISYFLNADASRNSTSSFLSGDRFLQSDGRPLGTGIFPISANTMVTWTPDQHNGGGNLLWSDGSVQQTANPIWRGAIQNQSFPTNRFLIP